MATRAHIYTPHDENDEARIAAIVTAAEALEGPLTSVDTFARVLHKEYSGGLSNVIDCIHYTVRRAQDAHIFAAVVYSTDYDLGTIRKLQTLPEWAFVALMIANPLLSESGRKLFDEAFANLEPATQLRTAVVCATEDGYSFDHLKQKLTVWRTRPSALRKIS